MRMTTVFRAATVAQPIALLAQAFLAGLALSGSASALNDHNLVGGVILLISAAQAGASVLLWRSVQIPRWPVAISIGLLIGGDALQMAARRLHLIALHLPLGVALFGASIGLLLYMWTKRLRSIHG